MRLLNLVALSVVVYGCGSHAPDSPLRGELVLRASSGLGSAIRELRQQTGEEPFVTANDPGKAAVIAYLEGPVSLLGSVSVPGATVLRAEVSSLRERVGSKEDGVRIHLILKQSKLEQKVHVRYQAEKEYSVWAVRESTDPVFYSAYPSSLDLGQRERARQRIVKLRDYINDSKKKLVAVERAGESRVSYFYLVEGV